MSGSKPSPRQIVLVVDDDLGVQDALRETLDDAGYEVICASNGHEAIALLRRGSVPSVILCDLMMPAMNGWDFVRFLRQDRRWSTLPLVVLTATQPYWGHPATRVLRKPVGTMSLLRALVDATNGLVNEQEGPPAPDALVAATSSPR
jgi:CheY-like chemotaxis protein